MARKPKKPIGVETLTHDEASRPNIPTAELQQVMSDEDKSPIQVAYERRNRDLDPQLVWRGKDEQDWSDLIVQAPPLYIQEKVHPKVLIDDLLKETTERADQDAPDMPDLFGDFNGLPNNDAKTEFYAHDANWTNRMILGDSLSVMASLAEREGLRGKVQCIYFDPPYGIKFNSNFQWSTTSRDVKDGKAEHISREPEQVKAFRDTWRDGIHSYLTYLRDRLTVARDLLTDSGSIFVQIGDENVHRVRAVMDEVFGDENFLSQISVKKTGGFSQSNISNVLDQVLWYSKFRDQAKFRNLLRVSTKPPVDDPNYVLVEDKYYKIRRMNSEERQRKAALSDEIRVLRYGPMISDGSSKSEQKFIFQGEIFEPPARSHWKTNLIGMSRLSNAAKLVKAGKTLYHKLYWDYSAGQKIDNVWLDTQSGGFNDPTIYVVQTTTKIIQRCILMVTDPGDLVLDPTCGSGTSAYVAEQWGRRWITIDTSRVALALARTRVMGARYPWYLLTDSPEGQTKEASVMGNSLATRPTRGDIRHGFVYERAARVTLKSIANNAEIDVIRDRTQPAVEAARTSLNTALLGHGTGYVVETGGRAGQMLDFTATSDAAMPSRETAPADGFMEWEVPCTVPKGWPAVAVAALEAFWEARIARQKEIDAAIVGNADIEYLYDRPYTDKGRTRVAGPFTVESLSPHRALAVDEQDDLVDGHEGTESHRMPPDTGSSEADFASVMLDQLKTAGVQQAHKEDRIAFTAVTGWPGNLICAEGRFTEGESGSEKRAGILIGPEFGTVSRPDLVAAAREAADAGFDVLIACAFNFDAHSADFDKLGRVPILKARMNADLHMADDLKNTGKGNLFVIFGEPDIDIRPAADSAGGDGDQIEVQINGVDVFHPQTGEINSDGPDGIACWFIDTDYNEESFFVRHAYFLGANDPYKSLKTTLKAEIDQEAWESLHSDTSRPFKKPTSGRIAVKVINHLGDEVMKVFNVGGGKV